MKKILVRLVLPAVLNALREVVERFVFERVFYLSPSDLQRYARNEEERLMLESFYAMFRGRARSSFERYYDEFVDNLRIRLEK